MPEYIAWNDTTQIDPLGGWPHLNSGVPYPLRFCFLQRVGRFSLIVERLQLGDYFLRVSSVYLQKPSIATPGPGSFLALD